MTVRAVLLLIIVGLIPVLACTATMAGARTVLPHDTVTMSQVCYDMFDRDGRCADIEPRTSRNYYSLDLALGITAFIATCGLVRYRIDRPPKQALLVKSRTNSN